MSDLIRRDDAITAIAFDRLTETPHGPVARLMTAAELVDAIRAIPGPTSEQLRDEALRVPEVARLVEAERERCAAICDAYADENIRMAGDSVLFDPVLSSKWGDVLTRNDLAKSENMMIDGAIHSAMFHAAQNIAAAIREAKP